VGRLHRLRLPCVLPRRGVGAFCTLCSGGSDVFARPLVGTCVCERSLVAAWVEAFYCRWASWALHSGGLYEHGLCGLADLPLLLSVCSISVSRHSWAVMKKRCLTVLVFSAGFDCCSSAPFLLLPFPSYAPTAAEWAYGLCRVCARKSAFCTAAVWPPNAPSPADMRIPACHAPALYPPPALPTSVGDLRAVRVWRAAERGRGRLGAAEVYCLGAGDGAEAGVHPAGSGRGVMLCCALFSAAVTHSTVPRFLHSCEQVNACYIHSRSLPWTACVSLLPSPSPAVRLLCSHFIACL